MGFLAKCITKSSHDRLIGDGGSGGGGSGVVVVVGGGGVVAQ